MSVYAEIIQWSENLPLWQRDALRRLTAGALGQPDIEVLKSMCLEESNSRPFTLTPKPLDASHVPTAGRSGPTLCLLGISETRSINAIVDSQALTFGREGLTIIYGDNGAGKSGFARVLRQVCHARGPTSPVLTNVYAANEGNPSATVHYAVDGTDYDAAWSPATSVSEVLGQVTVFDSVAATEFVEKENSILWTPGGLDLLEHLVSVVSEVKEKLEQEKSTVGTQGPLPQPLEGTTAFAYLQGLKAATPINSIDALALSAEEGAELVSLNTALTSQDPGAMAIQLRQKAQRLKVFSERVATIETALGESGLKQLQQLRQTYDAAVSAEQLLAKQTFSDSALPGVGETAWQTLWTAAEAYAQTGATPDRVFPSGQEPGLCVLCQQQLTPEAKNRLNRFHAFVRADVAQKRTTAATALSRALNAQRSLRAPDAADAAMIAEVSGEDPENGGRLRTVFDHAVSTQAAVVKLDLAQQQWVYPNPLPTGWSTWIKSLAENIERQRKRWSKLQPTRKGCSDGALQRVNARKVLLDGRALVQAEISRLGKYAALQQALGSCVTTGITRKVGELTKAHVTGLLVKLFEDESKALNLPHTVSYTPTRNVKGTSYQRVVLTAASWSARVNAPVQVLSEGERRSIALATFLAELGTRNDKSAVVLDDPVSY